MALIEYVREIKHLKSLPHQTEDVKASTQWYLELLHKAITQSNTRQNIVHSLLNNNSNNNNNLFNNMSMNILEVTVDKAAEAQVNELYHDVMLNDVVIEAELQASSYVTPFDDEQSAVGEDAELREFEKMYGPNVEKDSFGNPTVAKIILIGPSGAGKTAIFKRMLQGEFVGDKATPTLGVDFGVLTLQSGLRLQFWDTAGQER